ncbi:hypothetical protein [Indiicoccus explosivorum]|uniref:hypothetical protein n=1 Tax=Indiicoccus explosivorum TaxID=1917864 RepID=UPI0019D38211|nr:hypothetical protein [Indiicoccus explosivorum]
MSNFQRKLSISNSHVGRDFEEAALQYFEQNGVVLEQGVSLPVGIHKQKKNHIFDLGSLAGSSEKIIVECKSHKWTSGGNVPSAKMTVWNEAMYYFLLAPRGFRKIFFVLKDYSERRNETLGEYYIRRHGHLIPEDVEFLEYNPETKEVEFLRTVEYRNLQNTVGSIME